jgi:hypothetical protein
MTARPVEEVLRIEDLAVSQNEDDGSKEDALKKELDGVRNLNQVMEGVINAMTKAKNNMDVTFLDFVCNGRLLVRQWRMQISSSIYGSKS